MGGERRLAWYHRTMWTQLPNEDSPSSRLWVLTHYSDDTHALKSTSSELVPAQPRVSINISGIRAKEDLSRSTKLGHYQSYSVGET